MPKIINPGKIPEPYPHFVRSNIRKPVSDRFGVTSILSPPLPRTLLLEKWDEVEWDVAGRVRMIDGSRNDEIMERLSKDFSNAVTQLKMWETVYINDRPVTIVGKLDVLWLSYEGDKVYGDLEDWKFTTVTILNNEERLHEYEFQLNAYKWLLNKWFPWIEIRSGKLVLQFRDWSKIKAHHGSHPRNVVETRTMRLWSNDTIEQVIYKSLQDKYDNPHRECTPAERWQHPPKFAVMKKGRKSAVRVLDNKEELDSYCDWKGIEIGKDGHYQEIRPAQATRCKFYCDVASVCPYYDGEIA